MKLWLPLLFLISLISCKKDGQADNGPIGETYLNVAYGSHAQQVMDVYLPAGRSTANTKVMILIHGGAWSSGDKSEFTVYVDTLKKRLPDYAIFNINYRLAVFTGNFFPTQENDVKMAIEFIANKSAEYNISQKIVLLGASAGGHLALLQGYKYSNPVKPKAIIDFFGPSDMSALHASSTADPSLTTLLELLMGGSPATTPSMYQQSSPVNYVTAQSPPTIILQGGLDPLVPITQSTSLNAKLQSMNVVNQYIFYPTEGHGWVGSNLTHSFNAIQAFLTANVN